MRKALLLVPVLLSVLVSVLGLCWAGVAQAAPLQVAVGVAPLGHFAKKIGGDLVQVAVLVPAGADAHSYEPKPSQMRALARAVLYLSVGLEFEEAWEPRLKAANPGLVFAHTEAGLKRLPLPAGHDGHKGGHRKAAGKAGPEAVADPHLDPHVWVSPAQARQICGRIAEALSRVAPAHAAVFAANLAAFQKDIDALDAELRAIFSGLPAGRRSFLVFHPAWGYLAQDYGLTQTAIEFEGKEPSPRRMAAVIAQAKAMGARVIFVQPQSSRRTAEGVAQAIGARLVEADPLAEDWAANLRRVALGLRDALK